MSSLVKGRRLEESLRYAHVAKVTFRGVFPTDMLRYDRCCPLGPEDAAVIGYLNGQGERVVYLLKYSRGITSDWTVDRWRSFGNVTIEPVER